MSSAATAFQMYRLAQFWVRGLFAIAGTIFLGIVSILLGLSEPAGDPPVVELVRHNPGTALTIGGVLVVATVVAMLILWRPAAGGQGGSSAGGPHLGPRVAFSTALSTLSTTLFIGLLVLVLTRPVWCPSALCPPAKIITVTRTGATHDNNLEVYYTDQQAGYYVLSGDPAQYTAASLSRGIAAVRMDDPTAVPYRVVIGIHSLQQGEFGLIIEKVELLVQGVPPLPQPLNVWHAGVPVIYTHELFTLDYHGEQSGALAATFAESSGGFVQLAPGEADSLVIQINPKVTADLRFGVQVTYRVANESASHTLSLGKTVEVAFSDAANWHPYELQDGRLVPAAT